MADTGDDLRPKGPAQPEDCGQCRNKLVLAIREVVDHHHQLKVDSEMLWTKKHLENFLRDLLDPLSMQEILGGKQLAQHKPRDREREKRGKEELVEDPKPATSGESALQISKLTGLPLDHCHLLLRNHPSKGDPGAIINDFFNGTIDLDVYRKMDSQKEIEIPEKETVGLTKEDVERAKKILLVVSDSYSISDILCVLRHHPKSNDINAVISTLFEGVDMKDWREKDEVLMRKSVELLEKDCELCFDTLPVTDMFTLDCKEAHRFCFECIQRHIEISIKDGKPPLCPGNECEHFVSPLEVKQIFGEGALLDRFNEIVLRRAVEKLEGSIGCPKPGCVNWIVADTQTKVRCVCGGCNFIFCSMCREPYHYGSYSCAEVKGLQVRWMQWNLQDRQQHSSQEQKKLMEKRKEDLRNRIQELEKDENWKEQHLRLCPKCGRAIEKVAGCNAMVCGRDTDGGRNVQDGCGHHFRWTSAKPYKKVKWDAHMKKVDVEKLSKDDVEGVRKEHAYWNCDVCRENVLGIRFSCINCPVFNVCQSCEEKGHYRHNETHVFDIVKEEKYDQEPERSQNALFSFFS